MSHPKENIMLYAGIGIIAAAAGAQYLISYSKIIPKVNDMESTHSNVANNSSESTESNQNTESSNTGGWFSTWFARNFYTGGFEDKMSRREASLILGVRESASIERIKDAHRRILIINHPDKGGSAYIAAKVNEAKSLLLKGK